MALIIRQILDYAVKEKIIALNNFNTFKITKGSFRIKRKPQDLTQVYNEQEQSDITKAALEDYEETGAVADLAICLNFYL